jgi:hypothetical protein
MIMTPQNIASTKVLRGISVRYIFKDSESRRGEMQHVMCPRGEPLVLYSMYALSGLKDLPDKLRSQPDSWVTTEELLGLGLHRFSHGSGIG